MLYNVCHDPAMNKSNPKEAGRVIDMDVARQIQELAERKESDKYWEFPVDWVQCHTMSFLQNPDGTHGQLFFSALGIAFCPGGTRVGFRGLAWERDIDWDLSFVFAHNVGAFVSLLDDDEHVALAIPRLYDTLAEKGFPIWHIPTREGEAPPSLDAVERVIDELDEWMALTQRCAVVISKDGLGRAGTFAACWLARRVAGLALRTPKGEELPFDLDALLMQLRQGRPGAVRTLEQEAFVSRFLRRETARCQLAVQRLRMTSCARHF